MGTCGSRPAPVVRLQLDKKDAEAVRIRQKQMQRPSVKRKPLWNVSTYTQYLMYLEARLKVKVRTAE